jgi:hypothetical protein
MPEISFEYNSGKQPDVQQESKSTSLAYGFDAGLRYSFGKLALGVESSWYWTEAEFEFNQKKQKQQLNAMGVGLTVSYLLHFDRSLQL